jgi:3-phenylpropionate/trans-cinnamate dioxygenase ferredoxin reductase subunit
MMRRLVVVGASLAGLRAAQAARATGYDGGLVVVGQEPHLPYNRTPLSKDLLQDAQTPEQLAFPLGTLDVDWRLGTGAVALDRTHHKLRLADGEQLAYERLILATGSRARQWHGPGAELDGVHTLRDLDDALALRAALAPDRRLLIVGAGFIGCEVAASARKQGVEVTLVDIAAHPLLPLGAQMGDRWLRLHQQHGVDVRLGVGIKALHGSDHVESAELSDGERVEVDAVLFALGAQINSEWLTDSGLELNPAVVTDATLTSTNDPDILAAGDIAACPVVLAGGAPLRIEHWTTAAEHGQLAGRNALLDPGERVAHSTPPYFWSDQYDLKIQAIGCPALTQETELLERSPEGDRFVVAYLQGDRLVGVVAVNAAKRLAWYRRQLAEPPTLAEIRLRVAAEQGNLGIPAEVSA